MKSSEQISTELQVIFREVLDIPNLELRPSLTAKEVTEWDSLNHIRLISAIEQEFSVQLSSKEVEQLACVGDMVALLTKKLQ